MAKLLLEKGRRLIIESNDVMQTKSVFTKEYKVQINDVDFTRKLKLSAAFGFFQEIAKLHSDHLGTNLDNSKGKENLAWMLVRVRVDIIKYPKWEQDILIETWNQTPKSFQFQRDYLIKDMDGNILMKAVSIWVVVDRITKELKKSDIFELNLPKPLDKKAIDCNLRKITPKGTPQKSYELPIGCSYIDMNGHINNSKYVDFVMDCFSMDELQKHNAKSFQISYLNEALAGQIISLYKYTDNIEEGVIFVSGENEDNQKVFTAKVEI